MPRPLTALRPFAFAAAVFAPLALTGCPAENDVDEDVTTVTTDGVAPVERDVNVDMDGGVEPIAAGESGSEISPPGMVE